MSNHFKTADGQQFYQECDAKNHAKTLEDKTITEPVNVASIEVNAEVVPSLDESGTDATGTDATGTDVGGTDATGTDAVGTDAVGTDATGTDVVGTDVVGTDAIGTDAVGTDESVKVNFSKFNKAKLIEFAKLNELSIDEAATNAVIVADIEAQLIEKNQA